MKIHVKISPCINSFLRIWPYHVEEMETFKRKTALYDPQVLQKHRLTSPPPWWKYIKTHQHFISFFGGGVLVSKSCLTLMSPWTVTCHGILFVHGVLQARILEWTDISFSRGSSQPRDRTQISRIADRLFTYWAIREAPHFFLWDSAIWPESFSKDWGSTFISSVSFG